MPDRAPLCEHPDFDVQATVVRLEDTRRFTTELSVRCAVCGVRFRWLGLYVGSSPARPMTSVDAFTLHAPIEPDAHLTSLMAETRASTPRAAGCERDTDGDGNCPVHPTGCPR